MKPTNRPKRTPIREQQVSQFETRPGYYRRLVNDLPGRIASFEKAGYAVVHGHEENLNTSTAGSASQLGSVVDHVVNFGHDAPCHKGVLMEIPLEYYEEDQRAKQAAIEEKNKALLPQNMGANTYGSYTINGKEIN